MTRRFAALALATLLAGSAAPLLAQSDGIVRGIVRGPDGAALARQDVVLHRVTGSSGLTVATGTSAADGSFRLVVRDAAAAPDAVYFLAARYQNELYLGDAFKAPFDTTATHTVQVGVAETSARNLMGGGASSALPAAPAPPDPSRWLQWILPALALAALAIVTVASRARIPERRRLILTVARLDEAHEARSFADADATANDDSEYRAQRSQLIERLSRPAEV
ncbi:MAG: hypothetical protein ABIV28_00280 [Longimicrobiales bacterium]